MVQDKHILEEIAEAIADGITLRKSIMVDALKPQGERQPFTTQLSMSKAMDWWRQHRYDDIGKSVLDNMSSQDILELDLALSGQIEKEQFMDMEEENAP